MKNSGSAMIYVFLIERYWYSEFQECLVKSYDGKFEFKIADGRHLLTFIK